MYSATFDTSLLFDTTSYESFWVLFGFLPVFVEHLSEHMHMLLNLLLVTPLKPSGFDKGCKNYYYINPHAEQGP